MVELVHLVSRLQEENRQLAGQVGFLEARRQTLEEQVRLLAAPVTAATPATSIDVQVAAEGTTVRPVAGVAAPRGWWRRVGAWLNRA